MSAAAIVAAVTLLDHDLGFSERVDDPAIVRLVARLVVDLTDPPHRPNEVATS